MSLDISSIVTCENKSVTEVVSIELDTFKSRMGDFPITEKSPVELKITNQENKRLLIQGTVDFTALIPCGRCLEEVPTSIHFEIDKENLNIKAICTVKVEGKTGVEMEALTGVSVTLLTIYDMCKAIDKRMEMTDIHLESKEGGKSGLFVR